MNKKIAIVFSFVVISIFSALALVAGSWGASRTISGNDVTVNIVPGGGFDIFTITETVTGATIVANSWGAASCGLATNRLTCDYEGTASGAITYQTTGSGSVSGTIDGVKSADFTVESKAITGDATLPTETAPPPPPPSIVCSDGYSDYPEEACDDGNTVTETACPYGTPNCQLCNADCTAVLNLVGPYCGNGVREGVELCDGNDLGGAACDSESAAGPGSTGTLGCRPGTCDFDTNGCTQAELPPATCPPTCPITISGDNVTDKQNLAQCIVQAIDDNAGVLQRITGIARCLQASPLFQ